MAIHRRRLVIVFSLTWMYVITSGDFCLANNETFVLDSQRSRLTYISSSWTPGSCRTGCEFQLSGSFAGEFGREWMTVSNPSFAVDGEHASEVDTAILHSQFPRRASAFEPGFLSLDTNVLNLLANFGGSFAVKHLDTINLVSGGLRPGSDGPSYLFDVTVFAANELDCNGDGEVNFEDVDCLGNSNQLLTVLDFVNTPLGDINGDLSVGFADFLDLSANFGKPGGYTQGDLDVNGVVEFADFLVLSANFGASSQAGLSAVPEPQHSLGLVAVALLLVVRRGRA